MLGDIAPDGKLRALEDVGFEAPSPTEIWRVVTLRDYNTRVVVLGATMLGLATGVVGVFLLLRKRSLMGDAISHATLPGVCIAYMLMTIWGGDGKYLPGLLLGLVRRFDVLGGTLFLRHRGAGLGATPFFQGENTRPHANEGPHPTSF